MVNLEIYVGDMDRAPLANVVCNCAPRVDERITLLAGETPDSGTYRVLYVEHVLDPRRVESVQHVCVIVIRDNE